MPHEPSLGHVAIVLHAHMPYVLGHGRWPHGADWLNEAVAETYIPLVNTLNDLSAEGVRSCLTVGTSPVLLEQLADPRFAAEFDLYLATKERAAGENAAEFTAEGQAHLGRLAEDWRATYHGLREDFHDRYGRDLVGALRALQDQGVIEVMTCAATHGYLPLLKEEGSIRSQIRLGVKVYERHYGRRPRGIWLPECAYRPRGRWIDPLHPAEGAGPERPGLEEFLAEEGIEYFVVDRHLLHGGETTGVYLDRYEALRELYKRTPQMGRSEPPAGEVSAHFAYLTSSHPFFEKTVAFFTRDAEAALQVWSAEFGYPGDPAYLDFHKKHWPGGLRYWRVTDFRADLGQKEPYDPEAVEDRVQGHASHYAGVLRDLLRRHEGLDERGERAAVVCVPFDAELFGHWWHEGLRFLGGLLGRLARDGEVQPITLGAQLDRHRPTKVVRLPEGSWGKGGHHWIWLNDETRWTWEDIHDAESRMAALVSAYGDHSDETLKAILAQAGRELLLLQASDWQFVISAMDAGDYAALRVRRHYADFNRLAQLADKVGQGTALSADESAFLSACRERDALFTEATAALWQ